MIEVAIKHRFRPGIGASDLDVSFAVPSGGITVLFGPSGAGKSSIIAALAGLLRPAVARIEIDGQVLHDTSTNTWLPPEMRRIGVVFQDARLFPHLSVQANLRYGLRRSATRAISPQAVIELLDLQKILARRPHTLSGGERQRVAIGRALLSQPRLLTMDEPLANLDVTRRQAIMPYLIALRRDLLVPIVYVTHQIAEVATLADSVVSLAHGRVTATGPIAELSARSDLVLFGREDAGAVLDATVVRHDVERQLTEVRVGTAGSLILPLRDASVGTLVRLRIPADDPIIVPGDPGETSAQNKLSARIDRICHDHSPEPLIELDLSNFRLLARVTRDAVRRLKLAEGMPVLALLKSTSIQVLSAR